MVVLQQEFIPGLSYSPELDKHPSTVISYHGPFFNSHQHTQVYLSGQFSMVSIRLYKTRPIVHHHRVRPGNLLRGAGSAKEEHEEACELILRMGCFHIARNFLEQLGI